MIEQNLVSVLDLLYLAFGIYFSFEMDKLLLCVLTMGQEKHADCSMRRKLFGCILWHLIMKNSISQHMLNSWAGSIRTVTMTMIWLQMSSVSSQSSESFGLCHCSRTQTVVLYVESVRLMWEEAVLGLWKQIWISDWMFLCVMFLHVIEKNVNIELMTYQCLSYEMNSQGQFLHVKTSRIYFYWPSALRCVFIKFKY